MTTLADKSLLSGGDNKPPMLEKHLYDSWKSRMELYMMNRPHGRMILASVEKGPLVWPSITEDGVTRLKEYVELTPAEAIQADCDIKAINIILQGLPTEIYALVSQHRVAKDLWEKIKLLMQGTSLNKNKERVQASSQFVTPYQTQQFTTNQSTPLSITYPSNEYHPIRSPEHLFNPTIKSHNLEYAPTAYQQQQPKFSQPDSSLVVHVPERDDPIDAINHMMSFLTAVVTNPGTNLQYAAGTTRKYTPGASESKTRETRICYFVYNGKVEYAEIVRLKQNLFEQVQEKDSLMKTVSDLKNDLKMEENRNIDREIALEKKIKQLDNIIFKRGQSAQFEVPKELPKVSMVNTSLKELKRYLAGFDQMKSFPFIKSIKDIFNNFNQYLVEELADVQKVFYQMEQAVEQHRLESKTFEVKMNQVLSENERLLAQAIDNDIVKTVVNLSLNEGCETVNECQRCLELKTELLNKKDFVDKETYDKLLLAGSQPFQAITKNDRIRQTPSSISKNKVEAHPRNVKSSLNKRNGTVKINGSASVQNSKKQDNSDYVCINSDDCISSDNVMCF
ncbi:hypothetical protein Tco_1110226 [Tanacetum coccineum]|uniref:Integrase, catalytic region, zinc finger, CCHC-type, peptidase aspartic, catalytic n=1 Tax=Tanacetum coccineum TaxID=301880 RepID=A0ABQ5IID5_9ASTR